MKRYSWPDQNGFFGKFGGRFVPETLVAALEELTEAYPKITKSTAFQKKLSSLLKDYAGRPTPLFYAENLTHRLKGAKIYLKREDLAHTGSHKINNTLGQCLLAQAMGKKRVIAETGAGQHGVATATVAALLGLKCVVYMGEEDTQRQALNVFRMRLLGAEVVPVKSGTRTLKDAINEAMRDWVANVHDTFYVIGSVMGPHPYPMMVRDFQSVIGVEARAQILAQNGKLPAALLACVGGGSNAMGLFHPFYHDQSVKFFGVEAGGINSSPGKHSATLNYGRPAILHGMMTYCLEDSDGQVSGTHSVSAGLDYPGVGPEHAFFFDSKRAQYVVSTDKEALEGFTLLSKTEGIIPALETSHAVAYLSKLAKRFKPSESIIVCLSGRGDKDAVQASEILARGAKA